MQPMNEVFAHSSSMLTGQIQPVENSVRFTMLDPAYGPEAVALNQHRYCIQKPVPLCAQCVKECAFFSTESRVTSGAIITPFNMTIDPDVVSTYFPKISTRFLVAPLSLSFHRASPRLCRCAHHTS